MSESLRELIKFVQIGTRLDLKAISVEHILGKTINQFLEQIIVFKLQV